jgi:hypothetical protein
MDDRLIKQYETLDPDTLQDFWLLTASKIEHSLIEAGAKAGRDYSFLDLYKLAQPVVIEQLKEQPLK